MYNSNHKKSGILGYVYIVIAVVGFLYYLLTFTISINNIQPEKAILQSYCRSMLLSMCFIQALLGIYIKPSIHKPFLFLQSLATMLLFTANCFYIYAFFNLTETLQYSSQNAMTAAVVLITVSVLMHGITLFENKITTQKETFRPKIDVDFDFED
jgi:ABC-type transport system involved in cytochrome c biogenesis permease subunit